MPSSPPPPSSASQPPPPDSAAVVCPSCLATATGKFCSNCGGPLAGAICSACGAPLTPGGKFCHRCGAPARADATGADDPRGSSATLPWSVAAIALVALVALVAGQRFARSNAEADAPAIPSSETGATPPFAGATGSSRAPDISKLSPAEAAVRLYNRVMAAHEAGHADTVALFAPMAIRAYQMIDAPDLDERYDMGRIAALSGDEPVAHAQADTILSQNPHHLLGLLLAANAAHLRKDAAAERDYHARLSAAAPAERAKQLPEYITHENDITVALVAKRP